MQNRTPNKIFLSVERLIAIFLSVSLALSNGIGYAGPAASPLRVGGQVKAEAISIPEELGKIEESFSGMSGKTIIYIQDAHDSLEAQENIAKTIHYLVNKYGVKTVYEEGYEGPVPTDKYFRTIQDPKIREKVAYFLMDKLRLGGAEYAHITRTKDFRLIGADNLILHKKNIEKYQESAKYRKETEKDLAEMDAAIRKLAQQYFTRDLKEWMGIKERFDRQEIELLDYLKRTMSLRGGIPDKAEAISDYPVISLLLASEKSNAPALLEKAKLIDTKTLFEEISRFEDDYAKDQLKEARDHEIFQYYKLIQLLKRLNAIEVTEEEYEAVKKKLLEINTVKIAKFLSAQSHKSVVLSKTWESHIQSAIEFYEVARERDASIRSCLEEYRKSNSKELAVLVYGGFHKRSIEELLNESRLSYSIVTPKITSVSVKHQEYYKQLMQMGYNSIAFSALVATATRPPNSFEVVAAFGPKSEVRFTKQIDWLATEAKLGRTVDEIDLDLRTPTKRSEVRFNHAHFGAWTMIEGVMVMDTSFYTILEILHNFVREASLTEVLVFLDPAKIGPNETREIVELYRKESMGGEWHESIEVSAPERIFAITLAYPALIDKLANFLRQTLSPNEAVELEQKMGLWKQADKGIGGLVLDYYGFKGIIIPDYLIKDKEKLIYALTHERFHGVLRTQTSLENKAKLTAGYIGILKDKEMTRFLRSIVANYPDYDSKLNHDLRLLESGKESFAWEDFRFIDEFYIWIKSPLYGFDKSVQFTEFQELLKKARNQNSEFENGLELIEPMWSQVMIDGESLTKRIYEVFPQIRSEMRINKSLQMSLNAAIIFVDGSTNNGHAEDQAKELATLAVSDPKRTIVVYNTDRYKDGQIAELLKSFDLANVKFVPATLSEALKPYQFRSNVNLVHYSASEEEAVSIQTTIGKLLAWKLTRFVGEPGALAHGLKYLEAVKLKEKEAAQLNQELSGLVAPEIEYRQGHYIVSPRASESMRLLQEAQFVIVFAQAA